MLAKTFKGGRTLNGAKATINYLLNERVGQGTAKVLYGDSELTLNYIKLADMNAWSWSSGVLTFSEILTEEQKADVIAEFKKMMFPGMKEEQFNLLVVEHIDKGRTELHYIIPRLELTTGKAFNPYYVKKDLLKKDLFQDYINLKHGFTEWQDNRQVVPKKPTWTKKAKVADIRKAIDLALSPLIEANIIQNRSELIYQLQEWGYEISRPGKTTISIKDENGKNTKLKGPIYGQSFDDGLQGIAEEVRKSKEYTLTGAKRNLDSVRAELDRNIQYQAKYNAERYKQAREPSRQAESRNTQTATADKTVTREQPKELAAQTNTQEKGLENDSIGTEISRSIGRRTERKRGRTDSIIRVTERVNQRTKSHLQTKRINPTAIKQAQRGRRFKDYFRGIIREATRVADSIKSLINTRNSTIKLSINNRNIQIKEVVKEVLTQAPKRRKPLSDEVIREAVKQAEKHYIKPSEGMGYGLGVEQSKGQGLTR